MFWFKLVKCPLMQRNAMMSLRHGVVLFFTVTSQTAPDSHIRALDRHCLHTCLDIFLTLHRAHTSQKQTTIQHRLTVTDQVKMEKIIADTDQAIADRDQAIAAIADRNQTIADRNQTIVELEEENQKLKETLRYMRNSDFMNSNRWENNHLKDQVKVLEEELRENINCKKKLNELQSELQQKTKTERAAKKDLVQVRHDKEMLECKVKTYKKKLEDYRDRYRNERKQNIDIQQALTNKETESAHKTHTLELEVEQLKEDNSELEKSLATVKINQDQEIDKALLKERKKVEEVKKQLIQEREERDKEMVDGKQVLSDMRSFYSKKQKDERESDLKAFNSRQQVLYKQLKKKDEIISELEMEYEELRHKISKFPASKDVVSSAQLQWKIREQGKQVKTLKGQNSILKTQNVEEREKNKALAAKLPPIKKLYLRERMQNYELREALGMTEPTVRPGEEVCFTEVQLLEPRRRLPCFSRDPRPNSPVRLPPISPPIESTNTSFYSEMKPFPPPRTERPHSSSVRNRTVRLTTSPETDPEFSQWKCFLTQDGFYNNKFP